MTGGGRARLGVLGAWGLVAALALAAPARGQESVFNLPGFGLPVTAETMRGRALGGAGLGLPGEAFSLDNPAQLARFGRAGLYLSLLGQRTRVEDARDTGNTTDVVFPTAQMVVPAWGASSVGLGFTQYLDFDAALESSVVFEGDTVPLALQSEGGIAILSPSIAYALNPRTAVGLSLDVYLGSRELLRTADFSGRSGGAVTTTDSLARDFRALGVTVGAERQLGPVRIAASWHLRPTIESKVTAASGPDREGSSAEFELPSEITLGVTTHLTDDLVIAAALRRAAWGAVDLPGLPVGDLGDALEIGGGLEYAPQSGLAGVLGPETPLRLGYGWRRLPLAIAGEAVTEWTASAGVGRGFGGRSRLDLVLETGRRGTVDTHGLSERFLRLGVGLSTFEQWRRDAPTGPVTN